MRMSISLGPSGGAEVSWENFRIESGGQADGPTPLELMLCALGACTFEAMRAFCQAQELDHSGLSLEQEALFSEDLGAVLQLEQVLMLPAGFPEEARRPLLWMAENCPAKSLLRSPPVMSLSLAEDRSSK